MRENLGKYAPPFEEKIVEIPMVPPAQEPEGAQSPRPPAGVAPGAPGMAPSGPGPGIPEPEKPAFDLQRVCADRTLWPKTVALKRNVYFPAVLDGKVVGTLRAPKGTEARLVTIQGGKLGLEYRGGGAWLDMGGTDFEERARLAFP